MKQKVIVHFVLVFAVMFSILGGPGGVQADTVLPVHFVCQRSYLNRDGRPVSVPQELQSFHCSAIYNANGLFALPNGISCLMQGGETTCEGRRTITLRDNYLQTELEIARAEKQLNDLHHELGCVYRPSHLPNDPNSQGPDVSLFRPACTPSSHCPYYELRVTHGYVCANL